MAKNKANKVNRVITQVKKNVKSILSSKEGTMSVRIRVRSSFNADKEYVTGETYTVDESILYGIPVVKYEII